MGFVFPYMNFGNKNKLFCQSLLTFYGVGVTADVMREIVTEGGMSSFRIIHHAVSRNEYFLLMHVAEVHYKEVILMCLLLYIILGID